MNNNQGLLFCQDRPIDKLANGFIDWLNRRNGNPKLSAKVKVLYHTEPSWNDLWNIHENVAKFAPDGWTRSTWESLDAYTIYPCFDSSQAKKHPLRPKARLAFLRLIFPGYKELYVKSLAQYAAVIHLRSAKLKMDDPIPALAAVADQSVWIVEGRRKNLPTKVENDRQTAELLNEYMKTLDPQTLESR